MVTRDEIRELAYFQADESKGECALSCYFQPDPPQDRSHRREAIVAKDVVKQALKGAAVAIAVARQSSPAPRRISGESTNSRRVWEARTSISSRASI